MMTCSVAANYMRLSAGYRYIGSEEEKKAKKKNNRLLTMVMLTEHWHTDG